MFGVLARFHFFVIELCVVVLCFVLRFCAFLCCPFPPAPCFGAIAVHSV